MRELIVRRRAPASLEVHQVFQELFPIITTTDMKRTLGFHRDLLSFEVTYQFPEGSAPT